MLRTISIKVHHVDGTQVQFPVPVSDLQSLFRSAGIDLVLLAGQALDRDPMGSKYHNYPTLISEFRNTDRSCGHLIIGRSPPDQQFEVAGQLHDLEQRGLAAVYTLSSHVQKNPRDHFAQTIAHEIGHMLNLSHSDIGKFDSTMNALADRDEVVSICWERAGHDANSMTAKGEDAFYIKPTVPTVCYPFAYKARLFLSTAIDARIQPWGSNFEHSTENMNYCTCWINQLS